MTKSHKNKKSGFPVKRSIIDYFFFLLGSAFYAFSFTFFIDPNRISPGGLTGIAAVINYLLFLPTGTVLFCLNIPVLFLGFKKLGGKFTLKTLFVTALTSVLIDIFAYFLPIFTGDRLIAAIFGGALSGLGLALVMLRGGTTGGIDVIAMVLKGRFPYLSMGRLVLILDSFVIALATICYREIDSALFAVVAIFVSGKVMDALLYGADKGKMLFIVTDKGAKVSKAIFDAVDRGVTILPSYGGYRKENNETLLCALRFTEVDLAIKTVKLADPDAFTVVTVTGGIFGKGFEEK
ncbi:MAG: YitT family protein [Acutalibacteraceae bacterium]|nr:YitT family protein [Acutalibacteraceae bacterium]